MSYPKDIHTVSGTPVRASGSAQPPRPTVVVLMPMAFSVRNVVYSGILRKLAEEGWEVHLLMPRDEKTQLTQPQYADFALAASIQTLIAPARVRFIPILSFLNKIVRTVFNVPILLFMKRILRSAFNQRNHISSYHIYESWRSRNNSLGERLRSTAIEVIGRLACPAWIFYRLVRWQEWLYRQAYDLSAVAAQLAALKPDLLWSTACISNQEYPYVLAASDLSIASVTSILSFDNLTSRTLIPTFDHYLVWNRRMQQQILQYYPQTVPEQVTITGTPQFGFHRDQAYQWPREKTLRRLQLPENVRYFLYTTSSVHLAPAEPQLVKELAGCLMQNADLRDYWLVIRIHPMDDWARWQPVLDVSHQAIISYPWSTRPDRDRWTLSCPEDQALWVSSLRHADACLNIASTTSLDAAIQDRPVIGIRFENEPDAPQDICYEEYDTEHFIHLVRSGGLKIVQTWPELMSALLDAVNSPEHSHEERKRMAADEAGLVDGKAGERIVQAMTKLLKCSHPS